MSSARLLVDPPLSGPENMARDEALLRTCGVTGATVVRCYAWSEPTISLGYFQDYAEFEQLESPARELEVVRRTTGGGAILHDLELTYSIVMPIADERIRERPNELYTLAHRAIIEAVGGRAGFAGSGTDACASRQRGPFFCFSRRHSLDVVVPDDDSADGCAKLAGSAQRRTATAILQHGSLILDNRFPQQACATWRSVVGSSDGRGFDRAFRTVADRFRAALEEQLACRLTPSDWTPGELSAASRFHALYAGEAWTRRRQRSLEPTLEGHA